MSVILLSPSPPTTLVFQSILAIIYTPSESPPSNLILPSMSAFPRSPVSVYTPVVHCPLLTTGRWKNERAGYFHLGFIKASLTVRDKKKKENFKKLKEKNT